MILSESVFANRAVSSPAQCAMFNEATGCLSTSPPCPPSAFRAEIESGRLTHSLITTQCTRCWNWRPRLPNCPEISLRTIHWYGQQFPMLASLNISVWERADIWPYWCGHNTTSSISDASDHFLNHHSAGIEFRRQNLTFEDVVCRRGINFRRQNLTSIGIWRRLKSIPVRRQKMTFMDVRLWRLKYIPAL